MVGKAVGVGIVVSVGGALVLLSSLLVGGDIDTDGASIELGSLLCKGLCGRGGCGEFDVSKSKVTRVRKKKSR